MNPSTTLGNLKLVCEDAPAALRLTWSGEFDEREPGTVLKDYAAEVEQIAGSGRHAVSIDVSGVTFMNSSGIGFLTRFIRALADRGVSVEVEYDTRVPWQELSKRCMRLIFARLANVRIGDQPRAG